MSIEAWWPKLRQQSRDYLIDNNGDEVPPDLVEGDRPSRRRDHD